ncbi:MAG: Stage 0 sporulation protein YaaT [uncultured Thermomicrobiales bacterium]|uniref:Stage 0 sporulation protein YaaT n=1 Tax=uncultured Thermomicrobiales bacterium TaxID=1645740 RepID=A0A6J4VKM5_9BACT|nr:MAG: Stage 0 sporulation protein YaaT [uncultured Thermomicrobiales bacterium]
MSESCSADGGCSTCSFGQRLASLNEGSGEEWPVVLVRFRETSRTRFFAPGGVSARVNDWVVVETGKGEEAGKVIATGQQVRAAIFAGPLKPIQRLAEPHEVTLVEQLEGEAKRAMRAFREQIRIHRLDMKPIRAEFSFDAKRLTFYYAAENRVDFRELVRDLAKHFGVRIDLRQVGARDEARLIGGVGKCGRSLCCSSWLQTYPSVTVKQAKEQDLPLNPTKISGVCGRLLCCLSYENEQYTRMKRALPRLGQFVPTPQGTGKVIGIQTLKGRVVVYIEGSGVADFAADELGEPQQPARPAPPPREGTQPGEMRRARIESAPRPIAAAPPPAPVSEELIPAETTLEEEADGTAAAKRPRRRSRRGGRRGGKGAGGVAGGSGGDTEG